MSINSTLSAASVMQAADGYNQNSVNNNGLDINDFLKLLVAQLSNQDPMSSDSGSGGTDYISQLAQFTMLQQLSSLDSNIATGQSYSLIGKYVYVREGTDSELIFGRVDGVIKENGVNYLMVGGETYDMSKVYAVAETDESDDFGAQVLSSAYLIGKHVTATVGESTVAGIVEKIHIQVGVIYLVIGDEEVSLDQITEITTEPPAE